eukprot:GFUD01022522.1.p1 GENE.GFUD01022522.1~~GFUD01022522.1.p1  ORF type:complete len:167 (-),score=61.77 GFUD01022522.1:57-557(-)
MSSSTSLNLSIQRGSCYELSAQLLLEFFQVFGTVEELEYHREKGRGMVKFQLEEVARSLLYKNLVIGECTIFTWRNLDCLGVKPESGLCIVESTGLPSGWEKMVVLRSHFEQYCQVTGIVFLPSKDGLRRALVAFPSDSVAKALHGAKHKIGRAMVDIKEVASTTV